MNIETGIYRHFRGNLYFAERLIQDAESANERVLILYTALYPGHEMSFYRRLLDFEAKVEDVSSNPVQRFSLVQALPAEKMQMLLPGARVAFSEKGPEYQVVRIFEDRSVIFVQLLDKVFGMRLSEFLKKAFLLETF